MDIVIPMARGFSLRLSDNKVSGVNYPTSQLQKGLLLFVDGHDLAEEAVGFGVPVLKRGLHTIFPGRVEFTSAERGPVQEISAVFTLNLEERISRAEAGDIHFNFLYRMKDILAHAIRHYPALRGTLTSASSALRSIFDWRTVYKPLDQMTRIKLIYSIDKRSGKLAVTVDLNTLQDARITEVVIMNEQGAHYFNQYHDSSGLFLEGKSVGTWNEVGAGEAAFACPVHRIEFKLRQVEGATLFRGMELVGTRLAWSGFGYIFPPTTRSFHYELDIERLS